MNTFYVVARFLSELNNKLPLSEPATLISDDTGNSITIHLVTKELPKGYDATLNGLDALKEFDINLYIPALVTSTLEAMNVVPVVEEAPQFEVNEAISVFAE